MQAYKGTSLLPMTEQQDAEGSLAGGKLGYKWCYVWNIHELCWGIQC